MKIIVRKFSVLSQVMIVLSILPSITAFAQSSVLSIRPNQDLTVSPSSSNRKANSQLEAFKFGSSDASAAETAADTEEVSVFLSNVFDPVSDICITALRVGTCALMIHHGLDKIQNVDGFSANVVAKFFGFLPGPPAFWTLSAAATQVIGSVMLAVGIFARPVSLAMSATMITAVIFHLLNTGGEGFPLAVVSQHSYNYELAAMYVAVLTYFSAAGAGAYSVDELVIGGELNFYNSVFDSIFGDETTGESDDDIANDYIQNSKSFPWSK